MEKTMGKMGKPWENPWFWCFRISFFFPIWLSHVETQHWSILWAIFWWKSSRILEMEVFSCEILMDKWGIFWRGRKTWEPNHPERPKGYVVSLTSKRRAETADRIHIYYAEAAEVCFSITFAMRIAPKWPEVEDFTWFHSPILQESIRRFPQTGGSPSHRSHSTMTIMT